MTDRDLMSAVERLQKLLPDVPAHRQEFAKSLIHQYGTKGFLSDKQAWWISKMIDEANDSLPVVEKALPTYPNILDAFAEPLRQGRTKAALRAGAVHISLAARHPGVLYVKLDGEYVGKITPDGKLKRASGVSEGEVTAALAPIELDPQEAAIAYGRETGRCSICGRELTDPESIARAIGPVCLQLMSW